MIRTPGLLPAMVVVALCPMCTSSKDDRSRDNYDDYCEELGSYPVETPTGIYCQHIDGPGPDLTPDSGTCQVGGYCRSEGETCNSVYDDTENPACQLTRELRCVTNKWRGNLAPVEFYSNDSDCPRAPSCEDGGACSADAGTVPLDASDAVLDASDTASSLDATADSSVDADN